MYFPPEVWFTIKSMEYQMLYPPHIQKQYIDNIKSFTRIPFLLRQEQYKNVNSQIYFLKHQYPLFWNVFQEHQIKYIVEKELLYMNTHFNSIYTKRLCSGFNYI
uniref:Uncharacterized protein n=1 Tax=viral metagenome TaxID=1070528 RepID=A0A6C0KK51_9ZZZZ